MCTLPNVQISLQGAGQRGGARWPGGSSRQAGGSGGAPVQQPAALQRRHCPSHAWGQPQVTPPPPRTFGCGHIGDREFIIQAMPAPAPAPLRGGGLLSFSKGILDLRHVRFMRWTFAAPFSCRFAAPFPAKRQKWTAQLAGSKKDRNAHPYAKEDLIQTFSIPSPLPVMICCRCLL